MINKSHGLTVEYTHFQFANANQKKNDKTFQHYFHKYNLLLTFLACSFLK